MKGKDGQLMKGDSTVSCMVAVASDVGITGIHSFNVTNLNLTRDAH
jgi:hypothetical protein